MRCPAGLSGVWALSLLIGCDLDPSLRPLPDGSTAARDGAADHAPGDLPHRDRAANPDVTSDTGPDRTGHDILPDLATSCPVEVQAYNSTAAPGAATAGGGAIYVIKLEPAQSYELQRVEFMTAALEGSTTVVSGLYADAAGVPTTVPLASSSFPVAATTGWYGVDFSPGVELEAGQAYWISFAPALNVVMPETQYGDVYTYVWGFEFGTWVTTETRPWVVRFLGCPS